MMRLSWATMAFVGAVATALVAPTTSAMAQQSQGQVHINIFLKDADLFEATRMLTAKAGMQFVFEPSSEAFGKVTLKLDDLPAEDALAYICKAAGAYFRKDENGVFIISRSAPKIDTPIEQPKSVVKTLRRILVRKADVRNVYNMLAFAMPPNSSHGFEDMKKFKALTDTDTAKMFGNTNPTVYDNGPVFRPLNARANQPLAGSEGGSDLILPGEAAGQRGGGGGGLSPGGGGGQQGGGGNLGGGGGQNNQGGGGNNSLQGGTGLVPQSIDFISYDPTDNSIVVRGSEEDIAELQRYISLFDVAPRQVEIKVEFITTTESLDKSIGFDFLYSRGTLLTGTAPGTFARTSDPVFLNFATGNVTTRMRTLLQEGRGKVVSSPIIRTLNNQPATIASQITTYIFINQTIISNGTAVTNSNPVPLTANTSLSVAPRINDDNTITVFLNPTVASFVGTSRDSLGNEFPNLSVQSISVVARVKNGETIALGGMTDKNDNTTVSRVPLLSDLPIIGQFFRSTQRTKRNSDLLIFVTPRIVEEDEIGG
jgi:general secretion pathway protein D